MPGPQLITPGEILAGLPSDGWNGFVEAYRRVMQGAGQPNGPGGSSGARRLTALVKNNTGAAIDVKFGVVELDGPLFNTDDRETVIDEGIAFQGIEPDASTAGKDVAIYQGPVGDAQPMEAVIVGPTWVRLELPTWDETYTTAKATSGDCTKLTAGSGSIPVLWHATPEEATPPDEQETEVWALVMLGGGSTAGSTLVTFLSDATEIPAAELGPEVTDGGTGDKTVAITPSEFEAFLFSGDSAQTYENGGPDPAVTIKNYYLDRYIFPAGVWFTGTAEEVNGEYILIEISCAYQIKE